jgi:hypothetical protein
MKSARYERLEKEILGDTWKTIGKYPLERSYDFAEISVHFQEWFWKLKQKGPRFTVYTIHPWPLYSSWTDTKMLCLNLGSELDDVVKRFYNLRKGFYNKTTRFPLKIEYEQYYSAGMHIMATFKPSETLKGKQIDKRCADEYWWGILNDDLGNEPWELSQFDLSIAQLRKFIRKKRMEVLASCLFSSTSLTSGANYDYTMETRLYEDEKQIKVLEQGESLVDEKRKENPMIRLKEIVEYMIRS